MCRGESKLMKCAEGKGCSRCIRCKEGRAGSCGAQRGGVPMWRAEGRESYVVRRGGGSYAVRRGERV